MSQGALGASGLFSDCWLEHKRNRVFLSLCQTMQHSQVLFARLERACRDARGLGISPDKRSDGALSIQSSHWRWADDARDGKRTPSLVSRSPPQVSRAFVDARHNGASVWSSNRCQYKRVVDNIVRDSERRSLWFLFKHGRTARVQPVASLLVYVQSRHQLAPFCFVTRHKSVSSNVAVFVRMKPNDFCQFLLRLVFNKGR